MVPVLLGKDGEKRKGWTFVLRQVCEIIAKRAGNDVREVSIAKPLLQGGMLEQAVVCVHGIWSFALIWGVSETPPNAYFPDCSDNCLEELHDRPTAETIQVLIMEQN